VLEFRVIGEVMTLQELFVEVFELPPAMITDGFSQTTFQDWSSSRHMELVIRIEAEFAVTLTLEEIRALKSFALAAEILRNKGAALE
jgi:acyl carrier protein